MHFFEREPITQASYDLSPFDFRYQSGKVLKTIDSYHVAHSNLAQRNNAIEKFMFTKEYGYTRWEAWIPRDRCYEEGRWYCNDPDMYLKGRCDGGGVTSWGGQVWVRVDCRDSTGYLASSPYVPLAPSMAESDINSQAALTISQAVAAIPSLYRNILDRAADPSGHAGYHHAIVQNGLTLDEARRNIASGPEAAAKVRQIYRDILDVISPSPSQVSWETTRMGTGETTIPAIRSWYARKHPRGGHVLVKEAFRKVYGREIDVAALENHLKALESGSKTIQAIRADLSKAAQSKCEIQLNACPWSPGQTLGRFMDNYQGAGSNQNRCLARAQEFANWCGTGQPVTASFIHAGAVKAKAVSSTCLVNVLECPLHPKVKLGGLYDFYQNSSNEQNRCLARAMEYKVWCGSKEPVTATFSVNGRAKASVTR